MWEAAPLCSPPPHRRSQQRRWLRPLPATRLVQQAAPAASHKHDAGSHEVSMAGDTSTPVRDACRRTLICTDEGTGCSRTALATPLLCNLLTCRDGFPSCSRDATATARGSSAADAGAAWAMSPTGARTAGTAPASAWSSSVSSVGTPASDVTPNSEFPNGDGAAALRSYSGMACGATAVRAATSLTTPTYSNSSTETGREAATPPPPPPPLYVCCGVCCCCCSCCVRALRSCASTAGAGAGGAADRAPGA